MLSARTILGRIKLVLNLELRGESGNMKRLSAHVLVVDDFEQWRRLVRKALEKEGLHVIGEPLTDQKRCRKLRNCSQTL